MPRTPAESRRARMIAMTAVAAVVVVGGIVAAVLLLLMNDRSKKGNLPAGTYEMGPFTPISGVKPMMVSIINIPKSKNAAAAALTAAQKPPGSTYIRDVNIQVDNGSKDYVNTSANAVGPTASPISLFKTATPGKFHVWAQGAGWASESGVGTPYTADPNKAASFRLTAVPAKA